MNLLTVIVCAADCSSVQSYAIRTHKNLREIHSLEGLKLGLDREFKLIAVVEGWPFLKTRDDARTAEWGVL